VVVAARHTSAQTIQGRGIPRQSYYAHLESLNAGDYKLALDGFKDELRSGIRTAQSRWIDSICFYTMVGESYYKLGQYGDALDSYTAALSVYLAFPNWMVQVQYPPRPDLQSAPRQAVPWGRTQRNTKVGRFGAMLIQQGQPITEDRLRKGGVITPPQLLSIDVAEIVRCTCLSMKRRAELLGPLARHDQLTGQVLAALQRRPGVPNHWSQSWIDAQLGFAQVAAGNGGEAIARLQQSLSAGAGVDHPTTPLALLQIGRITLETGKLDEAFRFFEEATYSAADHDDVQTMEEAFRYATIVYCLRSPKNPFAALEPAAVWAGKKRRNGELQTSLTVLAAESNAVVGNTPLAAELIAAAKRMVNRRAMAIGEIGARLNLIASLTSYQAGNVAAGDEFLNAAIKIANSHSPWVFQLALTSSQLAAGKLSERNAVTIFERLANDPTANDWNIRPLECLTLLSTARHGVYEQWFEASRDVETALEVADLARRHRFYSALPFGGRLLALRWVLEAPPESIDEAAKLQRQDLLARYPAYEELSKRAVKLRNQLGELPIVPEKDDQELVRKQADLFDDLLKVTAAQELILRQIAVRREPSSFCFPPVRKTRDVQAALPEGTVLLNIFCTSHQTYATLLAKNRYANWKVENPQQLERKIVAMLRAMGNYDGNREIAQNQLTDDSWKPAARDVIDTFLASSKLNFGQAFDELIVVPDGILWYLPFEAVQVGDAKSPISLLSKTRVRYAPTMSLAVTSQVGRIESPKIGVVLGRLYPREDASTNDEILSKLTKAFPKTVPLAGALTAPSPVYGSLLDGLVVLDDLNNRETSRDANPLDLTVAALDRQRQAGALVNWMALPWKRTDLFVLPGFHTAAESGLKDVSHAGQDLFLTSCALLASGARTVLVSRWRTAGGATRELVRNFVQEYPFTTASEAWQRSVQLAIESPLDVAHEPRVKMISNAPAPKAGHPFFWAGYMVIDTGVSPRVEEPEPDDAPVVKLQMPENQNAQNARNAAAGKEDAAKEAAKPDEAAAKDSAPPDPGVKGDRPNDDADSAVGVKPEPNAKRAATDDSRAAEGKADAKKMPAKAAAPTDAEVVDPNFGFGPQPAMKEDAGAGSAAKSAASKSGLGKMQLDRSGLKESVQGNPAEKTTKARASASERAKARADEKKAKAEKAKAEKAEKIEKAKSAKTRKDASS
jgi:hypothetical protein